jgi:L-ornithine N5-oxygenase
VNEIFNPSRIPSTYAQPPSLRATTLALNRGTNYGVVRLPLLEHIYETLYMQRVRLGNEEAHWPHRIMPYRRVVDVEDSSVVTRGVRLHVQDQSSLYLDGEGGGEERVELLDVDAVFVATGYARDVHERLLEDARCLMPSRDKEWGVHRDYRVKFADGMVSGEAGVWLQGCCEGTHGVSYYLSDRDVKLTCE